MSNRKRGSARFASFLIVCALCFAPALESIGPRAQPPSAVFDPTEITILVDYGRTLYWCGLFDYSNSLHRAAMERTFPPEHADARLRVQSETVVYLCKTGQAEAAGPIAVEIRDQVSATRDAVTRYYGFLAVGYYNYAMNNQVTALSLAEEAAAIAVQLRLPDLEGQAALLASRAKLRQNLAADALRLAGRAIALFEQANALLQVAEALNHRADIYAAAGDQRAMQAARQRAFTTVTNTGAAPLLNYQQTAREAVALMREHVQAAEQGDYPKAQNDVLSLLILFKNQYRLSSADSAALRMNLSEAALLAHMGYYCQLQNHAQPARQFVALAQEAIPRETDSANKVLFRLILARHSRLIGQPRAMVGHIESAEQSLGIIADAPPELVLGIQEEKGLALFLLGFADQALTELEKAAELAKQSGSEKDRERLDYYILNLREKKLDAAIVTGHPRNLDAALRLLKRAQFGSEGPEIFRSPFAMDQPEGAPKSEAEALDKIALVRPVLKKISDNDYEVFMATRRWERAVPVIKEVIAEHGETTPRLLKLGECHFNLARWADAKAVYERILEIEPGNRRATEYLETVKLRLKN